MCSRPEFIKPSYVTGRSVRTRSVPHSVCLHAHLSQITAIVPLCHSIRQLQSSQYTCRWENQITGQSMSYPRTLGGAVPISTSGNRNTSSWPLYVTSCLGIQERWCTFFFALYHVNMYVCLFFFIAFRISLLILAIVPVLVICFCFWNFLSLL